MGLETLPIEVRDQLLFIDTFHHDIGDPLETQQTGLHYLANDI